MLNLRLWHVLLVGFLFLFLGGVLGGRIAILLSVIKASRLGRNNEGTLEQEEGAMVRRSPREWAELQVRLLESLEGRVSSKEYREVLARMQNEIDLLVQREGIERCPSGGGPGAG